MKDLSLLLQPVLIKVFKTNVGFKRHHDQEDAFQFLKGKFTNPPLLLLHDFLKTFEIESEVCCVLSVFISVFNNELFVLKVFWAFWSLLLLISYITSYILACWDRMHLDKNLE